MKQLIKLMGNFFKDKNGKVVVAQTPNVPLIVWFVGLIASSYVFTTGYLHNAFSIAATIALLAWALLEALKGVNGFRRTLGIIVIGVTAISIIKAISF